MPGRPRCSSASTRSSGVGRRPSRLCGAGDGARAGVSNIEDRGIETIRLAELGELTREELAAIEEDANMARARVGTDSERISGGSRNTPGAYSVDQQDVDLWEAVRAATGGPE